MNPIAKFSLLHDCDIKVSEALLWLAEGDESLAYDIWMTPTEEEIMCVWHRATNHGRNQKVLRWDEVCTLDDFVSADSFQYITEQAANHCG